MKKIIVFTVIAIFITGSMVAMAADKGCEGKNVLQSVYNWFGCMDKPCGKSAEACCKTCNMRCCPKCNADCGGKCCSNCGKT